MKSFGIGARQAPGSRAFGAVVRLAAVAGLAAV